MIKWWQFILFPFSILYNAITRVRNFLFDINYLKSESFLPKIISVGNLSVGGTGKTPMVDYLIGKLLENDRKIAVLSRGYGRKTKGFRICDTIDSPHSVGDEPYMYFQKWQGKIVVTVGEKRALAIPQILEKYPKIDVILLDDAYQHRYVNRDFNILLTTQQRPFWKDFLLPMGRLREARKGYKRADAIIITKANDSIRLEQNFIKNKPIFRTKVIYSIPKIFFGDTLKPKVVAVAGLADNFPFFEYIKNHFEVVTTFSFKDHHNYKHVDIQKITEQLFHDSMLLTTAKDMVKLKGFFELEAFTCAYLPIKINFLGNENEFLRLIDV